MQGIITKSTGSWYIIKTESGKEFEARIRGKFRLKGLKHTNPVAVGDCVDFETDKEGKGVIQHIHPRSNYIIRRSVNLSKKTHIIASNIDFAFVMITLQNPVTSTGFIDRFLVTCEAYEIPAVLLFNKIDLLTEDDKKRLTELKEIYQAIGYSTMEVSALEGTGISQLKERLKNRVSLFSGHSGVGKSTLVNALSPGLNLKTKIVSDFNKKGQHTTTFAQMYPWSFGGSIIDTPGIKEFGLVDMKKEEIQDYFPEIFAQKEHCKFNNCLHLNEPKCAVKNAVENGNIALSRFQSYLTFLDET